MAVLMHHGEALGTGDLDAIMEDYADDAVFISDTAGVVAGAAAIRDHFSVPLGLSNIQPTAVHVHGECAYVCWTADGVRMGTDTFVIRDSRIVLQTVTFVRD
jgi:ketosteroid isomerase-like protein